MSLLPTPLGNSRSNSRGRDNVFAEMKDPVKDKLRRFGLSAQFGQTLLPDHQFRGGTHLRGK